MPDVDRSVVWQTLHCSLKYRSSSTNLEEVSFARRFRHRASFVSRQLLTFSPYQGKFVCTKSIERAFSHFIRVNVALQIFHQLLASGTNSWRQADLLFSLVSVKSRNDRSSQPKRKIQVKSGNEKRCNELIHVSFQLIWRCCSSHLSNSAIDSFN